MKNSLKEISQISIYLDQQAQRINEVALFQPLTKKTRFNEESKSIKQRKWSYKENLSLFRYFSLGLQKFLFRYFPFCIATDRVTIEAKFKTVLALILAQEQLREFFLSDVKRRENFLKIAQQTAIEIGYLNFSLPEGKTPLEISQNLTRLYDHKGSLIEDLTELNLQIATLKIDERNDILFRLLNRVERPPITSGLDVVQGEELKNISITTKYAKYKILGIDELSKKINYEFLEDHATSSIRTAENIQPNAKGAMNQRKVYHETDKQHIGNYSGHLATTYNLLEQLLFLLDVQKEEIWLLDVAPSNQPVIKKTILFTSLYSWNEISWITDQHEAIRSVDQKILRIGPDLFLKLDLLYINIPFNAFNKYPAPAEMDATIQDINIESLIILTKRIWEHLSLKSTKLEAIAGRLESLRLMTSQDFFARQQLIYEEIDRFRECKKEFIEQLHKMDQTAFVISARAFLEKKDPTGKAIKGIDLLIHLDLLTKELGILQSKNCQNSIDRSAGANAADKAQYAYKMIYQKPFLPGWANSDEIHLYKVLYSMYLVWEEPEINAALSTGFLGEKFYKSFFLKNPETTRYMIDWLKKHSDMYLALSEYRS